MSDDDIDTIFLMVRSLLLLTFLEPLIKLQLHLLSCLSL